MVAARGFLGGANKKPLINKIDYVGDRSDTHAPCGGERPRFHHRAASRQVQGFHLRAHQGRQHTHAHSLAQRTRRLRYDALQEGCLPPHAQQGGLLKISYI